MQFTQIIAFKGYLDNLGKPFNSTLNNPLNNVKSFKLSKTLGPTIKTASIELHGVIMC